MTTRREFLKGAAAAAAGTALGSGAFGSGPGAPPAGRSLVVAASAPDMLSDGLYNPEAVSRAFAAGMRELTGLKTSADAWASLFGPDDVVGIKINAVGAPKISSSIPSIRAAVAGLMSAGVRENNIIVWDRTDREVQRTGLPLNKGSEGLRVTGLSTFSEAVVPWVEGYDREAYVSFADGTLPRFRELVRRNFAETASQRVIFNSLAWLWALGRLGDERAKAYEPEIRRLYTADDRAAAKKIADDVVGRFDGVEVPDGEKSFFGTLAAREITKLVNIAVLKHNEDSGVTWATKNIALGVTTNKVRFHIDYCATAIPEILAHPCLRDKMVLHIGEAARISTVSVAGTHLDFDNRIFFSRDPVAMDRIGLDILEERRRARGLESIRSIATHVAACARRGLGTDDPSRIDLRAVAV